MSTGKLNNGLPQVPPARYEPVEELVELPIHAQRERIMTTMINSQVTIVSGETGCGKTTQVISLRFSRAASCYMLLYV